MDAEEHLNQDHHLVRYVVALTAVAIGAAVALVLAGYSVGTIWVLVALCAAAAIAERASVRLSETLNDASRNISRRGKEMNGLRIIYKKQ